MQELQPTMEILEKIKQNSAKNKEEVFTRLYRYMLRPDLYFIAYKKLYANDGASTKGINDDTADGFSAGKIDNIIKALMDESYTPNPVRRTYIQKSNGKMRPLGIPTFTDKLVQEVLRQILEAVYEPIFSEHSHGFRPNRSCHTALKELHNGFTGTRWFVEGDIRGCFDNIDHQVLVNIINSKIKDARLLKLIHKLLKAGYLEDWQYHSTHSGTPQGGIVSPILANIYLNELDKFVDRLSKGFYVPRTRGTTVEYGRISRQMVKISKQLQVADDESKTELLAQKKALKQELLKTPYTSQTDKKMKYVRYADDFIIGVKGSKADCARIKEQLSEFIRTTLKMELSEEKTLITHSNMYARFLGYDVRVRRDATVKYSKAKGCTMRTLNNKTELNVPLQEKIMKFLFDNNIIEQKNGEIKPTKRTSLLRCTEFEIVSTYNAELRGKCNYYSMASNFSKLNYFAYLMEYSCLKTLCAKHKCTISKIKRKYKDGNGNWCIPYETKDGTKYLYFANYADCRKAKNPSDSIFHVAVINSNSRTTFEQRLSAHTCELCGSTDAEHYEIHHINKVKNLKGKEPWERVMIAKKRKTLVVCERCHYTIHGKEFCENGAIMESRIH